MKNWFYRLRYRLWLLSILPILLFVYPLAIALRVEEGISDGFISMITWWGRSLWAGKDML